MTQMLEISENGCKAAIVTMFFEADVTTLETTEKNIYRNSQPKNKRLVLKMKILVLKSTLSKNLKLHQVDSIIKWI